MATKKTSITIVTPTKGYRRLMVFNRFYVEPIDNFRVMHFGLVNMTQTLIDRYSAAIFVSELHAQKESLMDYLGRIGELGDPPPAWQPASPAPVEVCNGIGVTSNAEVAETTLYNAAVKPIMDLRQSGVGTAKVEADAVALLRSNQQMQKHLIRAIFQS